MKVNRRRFGVQALGAATAGTAATHLLAMPRAAAQEAAAQPAAPPARGNPIGVSTYSFWRFLDDSKLSIEQCIDEAARMGFDAVEILHMQMENRRSASSTLANVGFPWKP